MTPDRLFRLGLGLILAAYSLKVLRDLIQVAWLVLGDDQHITSPRLYLALIASDLLLFLVGYLIATV